MFNRKGYIRVYFGHIYDDDMNPIVTLVGIYRYVPNAETYQEQAEIFGEEEMADKPETNAHFSKLVLVEGFVEGLEGVMDFGLFDHLPTYPDDPTLDMEQVGYEEALLNTDGTAVIIQRMDAVEGTGKLRFAVFLHEFDPTKPINWMGKPLPILPVTEMPERLTEIRYLALS